VKNEYKDVATAPKYVDDVESNQRVMARDRFVFPKRPRVYDAYERDIAVLQVDDVILHTYL
jgi:hypothetical protein